MIPQLAAGDPTAVTGQRITNAFTPRSRAGIYGVVTSGPITPPELAPAATLEALLDALQALRVQGIGVLQLRERALEADTAAAPGDYDLLALSGRFEETVVALLEALLPSRVSVRVHAAKPEKRLLELEDPASATSIQIDLWREHSIADPRQGKPARRCVRLESLARWSSPAGPVLRLAPWLELALYVCHLHEKRKDLRSSSVRGRLERHAGADLAPPPECPADLAGRLRQAPADLLEGRLDAAGAAALGCAVLEGFGLLEHPPGPLERLRTSLRRKRRSFARALRAGPVVAVLGPDGAGKTTLLSNAPEKLDQKWPPRTIVFKHMYRHSIFRWLYKGVRKVRRIFRPTEPKEIVEVALSPFLFVGALINYRLLRAFGARNQGLLFDRFFPDLLVTNRKATSTGVEYTRSARLLALLAPGPDAVVLLAASPEELVARKAEMTAENIALYLEIMIRHHVFHAPIDFLVLRTDVPLERSAAIFRKTLESTR